MQTKKQSLIEVSVNTFTGLIGSWLIAYSVLLSVTDPVVIATVTTVLCTVWSLVRGWFIRRAFNKRMVNT